jgi:hypothetical protein
MLTTLKRLFVHSSYLLDSFVRDIGAGVDRSPQWKRVEEAHLKKYPTCAACGSKENLYVHHVVPFYLDRMRELEEANLITLCMSFGHHCHLVLGHGHDFRAFNPHVLDDASRALHLRVMGAPITSVELSAMQTKRYDLMH